MIIREENIRQDLPAFMGLAAENAKEVYIQDFQISWMSYLELNNQHRLKAIALRTDDGILVGFTIFIVQPLLHECERIVAACDTIFILPAYRAKWASTLVKKSEEILSLLVHSIIYGAGENYTSFFGRLGYQPTDILFRKDL